MKTGDIRNPGDAEPRELVERTIRVDQAGEFGAVRIYEGQLAALRWTGRANSEAGRKIAAMARAEREHNQVFDRLLTERRVRPTVLQPLWSVAGFALGAATALMGDKAAMACTVAVEETIDEHYAHQAAALGDDEAELRSTIEKFRAEEIEHKDTALAAGAEQAPAYEALTGAIKAGSRLAIWLSTRFYLERLIGGVSSVLEVVPALVLGVEGADVADGVAEGVDGSCADAPEMGLELCEGHFDRIEVRAVRRQEEEPGATLLEDRLAFALLWLGRLSRITTSPCCNVGASWVST